MNEYAKAIHLQLHLSYYTACRVATPFPTVAGAVDDLVEIPQSGLIGR
jgi:hypothetical protein